MEFGRRYCRAKGCEKSKVEGLGFGTLGLRLAVVGGFSLLA